MTKYICTQGIILHPALSIYGASGIVFIQLQGNDILVNCRGNKFIQRRYIFSHKSIIIRGNYILSRNYIHFKELISSFKEIFPRSKKTYSFREFYRFEEIFSFNIRNIYWLKFMAMFPFKETIFIEHCCVRGLKNCPQPLYDKYKLYNYYLLNKV